MGNGISKTNFRLGKISLFLILGVVATWVILTSESESWAKSVYRETEDHRYGEILIKLRQPKNNSFLPSYAYVDIYARLLNTLTRSLGDQSVLNIRSSVMDKSTQVLRMSRDQDISTAIEHLKRDPDVQFAEPNAIFEILDNGIPNDPDFEKNWGIQNVGQKDDAGNLGKVGSDLHVLPLWQQGIRGLRKVVVGIIDTGMDWNHPDLKDNLYTNSGEIEGDGIDNDGNGLIDDIHGWNFGDNNNKSQDDQGHGTHCAGIIGGVGNNGIGVAGVNWEVSMMPIKFLNSEGHGTLQAAVDAIRYGIKMKIPVLSNSWGGRTGGDALLNVIQEAKDAGITFIAAAGNNHADNSQSPTYPASYPVDNIISVAATDNQDHLGNFSNFGKTTVHVAAPGVKIYSTFKDGGYKVLSGTSMAAPHVSGVVALLLSASPDLNYTEIKKRLIETSDPIPGLRSRVIAEGRVNAYNAFYGIIPANPKPDPTAWVSEPLHLESEHPYPNKVSQVFEVSHPGAQFIRIHFSQFEMESNFDHLYLETLNGDVVADLTGKLDDYTSDYIESDRVRLRMTSDRTTNQFGFVADRLDYILKK